MSMIPTDADHPVPVSVSSVASPIPIIITGEQRRSSATPPVQQQDKDPSLPARTTFQEDLTYAGQRRINLIWEWTQAIIALGVVFMTTGAGIYSMIHNVEIPTLLAVAFGTVVGFYFSRTNHAAIGGVGIKPQGPYEGR